MPPHTHTLQLFESIIGCAYLPTCPLAYDEREDFLQGLLKSIESFLFIGCAPTGNARDGSVSPTKPLPPPKPLPPKPVQVAKPYYPPAPPPPAVLATLNTPISEQRRGSFQPMLRKKGILHKGTPHLTERRGSLTDLRMRPKEMNVVSIADLKKSLNPRMKTTKVGWVPPVESRERSSW